MYTLGCYNFDTPSAAEAADQALALARALLRQGQNEEANLLYEFAAELRRSAIQSPYCEHYAERSINHDAGWTIQHHRH